MRPNDLPINETIKFVLTYLPSRRTRILEVGCGNGELALRLQALGHEVIAIDSSADAIQQAQQIGVDAKVAEWPQFEEDPFDVILYTRSLHHIHPLVKAVEKTDALLRRPGLVMVEDFEFDEITPSTVEWFYSILSLLDICKRLSLENDSFGKELLNAGGAIEVWHRNHDHDLNPALVMQSTLKEAFEMMAETSAPYLYRYLCPLVENNEDGYAIASRVLQMEKRLESLGAISFIGRRFVCKKR